MNPSGGQIYSIQLALVIQLQKPQIRHDWENRIVLDSLGLLFAIVSLLNVNRLLSDNRCKEINVTA